MGSDFSIPREDRLEKQALIAGMIAQIVWELTGGLDNMANDLLGLNIVDSAPPHEPYMEYESQDDSHSGDA